MNNQRLILLLVFFFSIMMLWDAWLRHGQPAQPATAAQQDSAVQGNAGGASSAAVPSAPTFAATPGAVPATGKPAAAPGAVVRVKTDLVVADISAQGGDLVRLELLHHHATENKKENFILFDTAHFYSAQSGLIGVGLPNHKSVWRLPAESLALKEGENEVRVALEAPVEGGGKVVKTYVFKRGSYLVDVEHALVGVAPPAGASAYFQLTRDDKIGRASCRVRV